MNLKSGKWIGHKAKIRIPTPRTEAASAVSGWVARNVEVGEVFPTSVVIDAFPKIRKESILAAMGKLWTNGVIEIIQKARHLPTNRRLK